MAYGEKQETWVAERDRLAGEQRLATEQRNNVEAMFGKGGPFGNMAMAPDANALKQQASESPVGIPKPTPEATRAFGAPQSPFAGSTTTSSDFTRRDGALFAGKDYNQTPGMPSNSITAGTYKKPNPFGTTPEQRLGMRRGGRIPGKINRKTGDDTVINAKKGEYVLPVKTTDKVGRGALDRLVKATTGKNPMGGMRGKGYEAGGYVGSGDDITKEINANKALHANSLRGQAPTAYDRSMQVANSILPEPKQVAAQTKEQILANAGIQIGRPQGKSTIGGPEQFTPQFSGNAPAAVPRPKNAWTDALQNTARPGALQTPGVDAVTPSSYPRPANSPQTALPVVAASTKKEGLWDKTGPQINIRGALNPRAAKAVHDRVDWSAGSKNIKDLEREAKYNDEVAQATRANAIEKDYQDNKSVAQRRLDLSRGNGTWDMDAVDINKSAQTDFDAVQKRNAAALADATTRRGQDETSAWRKQQSTDALEGRKFQAEQGRLGREAVTSEGALNRADAAKVRSEDLRYKVNAESEAKANEVIKEAGVSAEKAGKDPEEAMYRMQAQLGRGTYKKGALAKKDTSRFWQSDNSEPEVPYSYTPNRAKTASAGKDRPGLKYLGVGDKGEMVYLNAKGEQVTD